ncbi:MAG: DUF6519 domain-containing protein [Propionivibrio sp.]
MVARDNGSVVTPIIGSAADGRYRSGNYWLIPARVTNGSIEWSEAMEETGELNPQPLPPRGIEHHYAPLDLTSRNTSREIVVEPCRCTIIPAGDCVRPLDYRPEKEFVAPKSAPRSTRGMAARKAGNARRRKRPTRERVASFQPG